MGAEDDGSSIAADEKILIIASAVLGTILVTLMCFAALYKSFLSQYANAYDSHLKLLNPFNAGDTAIAMTPQTPTSPPLNQVQIKLASTPSNNDFEVSTNTVTNTVAETSFAKAAAASYAPPDTGLSPASNAGTPLEAWGSPTSPQEDGEFFSADEQAKIWAELREAENDAAGASGSVDAARAAAASANMALPGSTATVTSMGLGNGEYASTSGAGEYVETFSAEPAGGHVQMAQSVTTGGNNAANDDSDDSDDDDANTQFGFSEADLASPSPAKAPAAVSSPDYVDGDQLVNTGEVDNTPGYSMGVNADNEWWK